MPSRFDALARMYEEMFRLPWRSELEQYSVLKILGPLSGQRVLDIGCGTGHYCRALRFGGAARVVGYDTSEGMIEYARRAEARKPLGVEYTAQSPTEDKGTFDIVLGVYVLPYAEDFPALVGLCSVAADALRPGGRFLTLPVNPAFHGERDYYERYGLRLYDAEPRGDASRVTLELRFGDYNQKITARHWSRQALEAALSQAGFASISWPAHRVSPNGLKQYGKDFWRPYLRCPHASLIHCRKQ